MKRHQRILLTGLSALAGLAIGLSILFAAFLASPIPARLAAEAITQATGMRTHIGTLRLGWFGQSRLHDLTLTSPHGGPPLLTLEQLRVDHAALWRLAMTRDPALEAVALEGATITLWQDDEGRWNYEPLFAAQPKDDAPNRPRSIDAGRLRLPAVMMRGTRVAYRPAGQTEMTAESFDMTIEATPEGDRITLTNERDMQVVVRVRRFIWPDGTGLDVWRGLDADVAATFSNVEGAWLTRQAFGMDMAGPGMADVAGPDMATALKGAPPLGTYTGRASFVASPATPATQGGEITFELTDVGQPAALLRDGRGVVRVDLADAAVPRVVVPTTHWQVADGEMELWGRASRADQQWRVYANAQMNRVPMQPLLVLAGAGASAPVGRLDGDVRMTLPLGHLDRAYGDVRVKLSQSDLANTGLFAAIYNVFNVRLGTSQPTGRGEMVARLEGTLLDVRALRYANRGADMRLAGRIENIYLGAASPLRGYAMGSMRPLPNLPLLAGINDVLGVLGQGVTAMRITGTLAGPKVEPMSVAQARSTLGQIIRGGKAAK